MSKLHVPGNKNQAQVERKEGIKDMPAQRLANKCVSDAGRMILPSGMTYQGSVTVHMYRHSFSSDTYAFVIQLVGLDEIPEGQADVALKELRLSMMAAYGREPEKTR